MPPQQALRHLDKAFTNFFAGRARYPTFKKKHGRRSAEYTTSAFTWDGKQVTLAKMAEPLLIRWSRPLPESTKPTTITVTKDQAGRYFVSFLVEEEIQPLPVSQEIVGIDLGLLDAVTLSTGEKAGSEQCFRKEERAWPACNAAMPRSAKARRTGRKRAARWPNSRPVSPTAVISCTS